MHGPISELFPTGPPRALDDLEFARVVEGTSDRTHGCVVLDLRGDDPLVPSADHVRGSAWVPLAAAERVPVWLLPAPGRPVVVVASEPGAAVTAARLGEAGCPAWWLDREPEPRWLEPGPPRGALWDIDPYLRARLADLPSPSAGPIVDLGCGSARESVFLAQRGHRMVAVDRLDDALDLARRRAAHHGVGIETLARRLRAPADLPPGPFAGALLFRFGERAILPGLGRVVQPGGVLILRTFGVPAIGSSAAARGVAGPRRADRRLDPESLRSQLGDGWEFVDGPRAEEVDGAAWTVVVARRSNR